MSHLELLPHATVEVEEHQLMGGAPAWLHEAPPSCRRSEANVGALHVQTRAPCQHGIAQKHFLLNDWISMGLAPDLTSNPGAECPSKSGFCRSGSRSRKDLLEVHGAADRLQSEIPLTCRTTSKKHRPLYTVGLVSLYTGGS